MKRKRGSTKRKPRKLSGVTDVPVDHGYYSDVNKDNDGLLSIKETKAKEVGTHTNDRLVDFSEAVINSEIAGSAAAKLPRAISSSRAKETRDEVPLVHPRIGEKEPKSFHPAPLYDREELDAAHAVIKKIMKMDASLPFNAPVDPIALGIPDYFDVIDTPMDFGTICNKIGKGLEYKNSKDVFKDVQRVWENCSKYNKKGSYILELMKRVKNNFMKQWTAAGLYKEQYPVGDGNLAHNVQPLTELTMMLDEPSGSNTRNSVYSERQDLTFLNERQHQHLSPYCSNTFKLQPIPYPCSCSLYPGQHQHDLVPPYSHHNAHLHPMDHTNGHAYNPWVNEASPSIMHSYHPPHSFGHTGHPQQRNWMHQSSSIHLPPSNLQAGINTQNTGRNAGDENHQHHYQMDSVPMHSYQPSQSYGHAHLLNQSTHHQLQNFQIDGGRNHDCTGTLPVLPPTESTANCTTGNPRAPVTDNTSGHQPYQINSTPKQSSSMNNNIEACDPLENTCHNELGASPSDRLHSTSDNIISKRKTRDQERTQFQELSPSVSSQGHGPEEDNFQEQTVNPLPGPSPLNSDLTKKLKKKSRGRGPARDMFKEDERISITTNEMGQPVGPEAQKFSSFLGTLARNGHFLPLTYRDWRSVPLEYKETLWHKVQFRFEIDPDSKDWVLHSLSLRWKNWKSMLKTSRYNPHETDEERLADRDERVLPEQWAALVALWNTEDAQKQSAKSKASRAQMKYHHTTGRKSFARIREEQKAKRPDGKEPTRTELFIFTRTRKDGTPVNAETSEVIEKLRERVKEQDVPDENEEKDVLTEIIGPSKKGLSRCITLNTPPSNLQKPTRTEAIKIASEAKMEIHEMKEKMAVMEQTCSQMASQMAAMMSMMSSMHKNLPDKNVSNVVALTSVASEQSLPDPLPIEPTPSVDAVSQVSNF